MRSTDVYTKVVSYFTHPRILEPRSGTIGATDGAQIICIN